MKNKQTEGNFERIKKLFIQKKISLIRIEGNKENNLVANKYLSFTPYLYRNKQLTLNESEFKKLLKFVRINYKLLQKQESLGVIDTISFYKMKPHKVVFEIFDTIFRYRIEETCENKAFEKAVELNTYFKSKRIPSYIIKPGNIKDDTVNNEKYYLNVPSITKSQIVNMVENVARESVSGVYNVNNVAEKIINAMYNDTDYIETINETAFERAENLIETFLFEEDVIKK